MSDVLKMTIGPDGEVTSVNGNEVPAPTDGDFGHGVQDGSAYHVDADGNVTRHGGVTRMTTADLRPPATTVLSTARGPGGAFRTGPALLKPGTTVEIEPGNEASRTDIDVALRMGYLEQDQLGNLREVGTRPEVIEAQQRTAQHTADAQRAAANAFPAAAEAVYNEALSTVHPGTFAATVNSMIEDGSPSVANVHAIADQTGKSYQEVTAMLGTLMNAFQGKAAEAMKKAGLQPSEAADFDRWCRQHRADEFLEGRLLLAHGRDGRKITELARDYLGSNPPPEAALNAAGLKTFTKGGVLFVHLPGKGIISVGAAARLGWV